MQVLQKPDAGTAVHIGDRKSNMQLTSFPKMYQLIDDMRFVEKIEIGIDMGPLLGNPGIAGNVVIGAEVIIG